MIKNEHVGIDNMTVEMWQQMTAEERVEWKHNWSKQGQVSFSCLKCGFPTVSGQFGCEACSPIDFKRIGNT